MSEYIDASKRYLKINYNITFRGAFYVLLPPNEVIDPDDLLEQAWLLDDGPMLWDNGAHLTVVGTERIEAPPKGADVYVTDELGTMEPLVEVAQQDGATQ